MVFSSKISKFGKGDNISLYMETEDKICVYYLKDSVFKKELKIIDNEFSLNETNENYPYHEIIQINNFLITRIDKSIGIKSLWTIKQFI